MGLDVKEKKLLQFIAKVLVPLALLLVPLAAYTGVYRHPLWALGLFTVVVQVIKLLKYLIERLTRRPKRVTTYGQWAIVTGATSGIGEAFAHELAKRGMSLLIISRSQDKLERVRGEIRAKSAPGAQVEVLAHDFTKGGAEADAFYAKLAQVAAGLDGKGGVGLLVNNVGVNVEVPEFFHELPETQVLDIVRVNVDSTVRMTRTILPFMAKRRSGAIINISSGSGNHPTPLLSTYAATKAFINEFSRSLHYEARAHGVDVLVVTPYYVTSNMYKKPPGVLNCSAERFVQDTLPLLGRYDIAFPYLAHAVLGKLMGTYWATPQALFKSMSNTRARALERKTAKAGGKGAAAGAGASPASIGGSPAGVEGNGW